MRLDNYTEAASEHDRAWRVPFQHILAARRSGKYAMREHA